LEDGSMHKNLRVWQTSTGQEVASFSQKSQEGWNVQYTEDEAHALRMVSGEVHVFATADFQAGIAARLRLEGATSFSLSPGKKPSVALFVAEHKSQPASVKIYPLAGILAGSSAQPTGQKTFFKADKVQMKWNAQGTTLLFVSQTEVDKTNKSYYGETNMYLMGAAGNFDCRVTLGAWSMFMVNEKLMREQKRKGRSMTSHGRPTVKSLESSTVVRLPSRTCAT
jgi:translation initiation factor 2A